MRLFLALPIPDPQVDALWPLQDGVPGAEWTEPADHHLTLVFLGETPPHRQQALEQALAAVRFDPFALQMQGLGFFPPRGQPKHVWAGVRDCEPLMALQQRLWRLCFGLGLPVESRKFAPHITLARLRNSPPHRVAEWLGGHAGFASEPWQADHLALYASHLDQHGARYHVLQRYWAAGAESLVGEVV